MTLEFWAMAAVAVAMLVRLRFLEDEREAMRAWHRGEQASREKLQGELLQRVVLTDGAAKEAKVLVAKLDAVEAKLREVEAAFEDLKLEHGKSEYWAFQIHLVLNRHEASDCYYPRLVERLKAVLLQVQRRQTDSLEVKG